MGHRIESTPEEPDITRTIEEAFEAGTSEGRTIHHAAASTVCARHALHSSKSPEHFTPQYIMRRVHAVLGGIDIDPASCAAANTVVQAKKYFTKADDGLKYEWHGNVFLNPPSGRQGRTPLPVASWEKLNKQYNCGNVHSAIYIAYSANTVFTSLDCSTSLLDWPMCFPRKRIDFLKEDSDGRLVAQGSPTHHNVIVLLPPKGEDYLACIHRFAYHFGDLGWVGTARRFQDSDFIQEVLA